MPAPRVTNQWPTAGDRHARATLQYSTPTTDGMGGRGEPTWTDFGVWRVKAVTVPDIKNDTQSAILYQLEGPYRRDLVAKERGGIGVRLVVALAGYDLVLKLIKTENPQLRNRTLVAHCADAVNTQ